MPFLYPTTRKWKEVELWKYKQKNKRSNKRQMHTFKNKRWQRSTFKNKFAISLITTLIIQTQTKKSLSDICPKPKKLYKLYKLYNAKYVNLWKQSNKFHTKPKEKICLLPLCDLSNLIFSTLFEEEIKCNYITSQCVNLKISPPNLAYFRLITIHLWKTY
jgi:hypothetical protein